MSKQTCAYCGARNSTAEMHSGILECDKCWYDRKMNLPAARHWSRVSKEFLSNIDTWDYMSYVPAIIKKYQEDNTEAKKYLDELNLTPEQMFEVTMHVATALRDVSQDYVIGTIKHLTQGQAVQ